MRSQGVGLADCARRLGLAVNTVKRYDRAEAPERLRRDAQYRPTLVDPYRDRSSGRSCRTWSRLPAWIAGGRSRIPTRSA